MIQYLFIGIVIGAFLFWMIRKLVNAHSKSIQVIEGEAEAYNKIIYDDDYGRGSKHNAVNRFHPDFKRWCKQRGEINIPAPETIQKMLRPSNSYTDKRIIKLIHEFYRNKNSLSSQQNTI